MLIDMLLVYECWEVLHVAQGKQIALCPALQNLPMALETLCHVALL